MAESRPPRFESTNVLQLLPPFLNSFSLGWPPLCTRYILDALTDTRCLLGLKTLDLAYPDAADDDETEDTQTGVRQHHELKAIKEAAAMRGIVVDWPGLEWEEESEDEQEDEEERTEDGEGGGDGMNLAQSFSSGLESSFAIRYNHHFKPTGRAW